MKNVKRQFPIFCDGEQQEQENTRQEGTIEDVDSWKDCSNIDGGGMSHKNATHPRALKSDVAAKFDIYHDESDCDDDDDDDSCIQGICNNHGDTASLADIMDVMKDISPLEKVHQHQSRKTTRSKSSSDTGVCFEIFCDDDSEKDVKLDDGTVLTADFGAFGDLSFIPSVADGDTCNLQDSIKNMFIS
jgi:hypothetical protein